MGAFLPALDFYIVNLALPAIWAGLRTTGSELQLLISSYASAYAVFLITGGRLGDLYGRRRMFMTGMACFVLASIICGFAPNGLVLICGRILQGASAAVMVPQVLATIRILFSVEEQPSVIGLYGSVFGLASIVGQLLGGALITWSPSGLTWQSIFLINVPIGVIALLGRGEIRSRDPALAAYTHRSGRGGTIIFVTGFYHLSPHLWRGSRMAAMDFRFFRREHPDSCCIHWYRALDRPRRW